MASLVKPSTRILLAAALLVIVIGAGLFWWFSRETEEPVDQMTAATQLQRTEPFGSTGAYGLAPGLKTEAVSSSDAVAGQPVASPGPLGQVVSMPGSVLMVGPTGAPGEGQASVAGAPIEGTMYAGTSAEGIVFVGTPIDGTMLSGTLVDGTQVGGTAIDGTSISGASTAGTSVEVLSPAGDAPGTVPLVAVFGVERLGETSQLDAIAVVGIDKETGNPLIVTLRPDESIEQMGTVSSVYADYGSGAVTKFIGELLSIPLTQYIVLDYGEFESIIDKLGGVEVTVNESVGVRRADGTLVTLTPGTRNLNGAEALAYIRYKWAGDERSRLHRQAAFLQSLGSRLSQRSTVGLLPSLVRDAFALIETNITLPSALSMIERLRLSDMSQCRLVVIAGARWDDDNVSAFRSPADFVESGIRFDGIEQAR